MEDIRGIQHPLQTPLVLECIFKKLGVSFLKECRQVCRVWRGEATKIMRPLVIVDIKNGREDERGVDDFLELVQSEASTFSESPFVNEFHIMNFNEAQVDPAFWEFCGSSIKSLYLVTASFQTDDEFGHAILESCSNLETLILQEVHVNPEGNVHEPVIWVPPRFPQNRNLKSLDLDSSKIKGRTRMEILSNFPCLEELTFGWIGATSDWVFRTLTILRERDNQGWPLKSLSLDFSRLDEPLAILPVLVDGNLALEELDAKGIRGREHGIVLRNILEAHANTLRKLTLVSWIDLEAEAMEPLKNIRLEKLECLELFGVDLSLTNLLRNVPNLKRLDIDQSRVIQRQPEDLHDNWVLTCCTELEVDLEDNQLLEPGELHSLLRRLPNLETLALRGCDNQMFEIICDLCPNLTYLSLWRCEVDDCGISGLDLEHVERINQEGANGWTWWRPITVARANLSNLKKLKWLSLIRRQVDHAHALGFCAALCGVQQLPQIQHLHLDYEGCLSPILTRLMVRYPWVDKLN